LTISKFILYAPNIHTGGGLILLKEFLASWPSEENLIAFLDQRVEVNLVLPKCLDQVFWVKPTIYSRIKAEFLLWRAGIKDSLLLCFNGLPPVFPSKATVYVCLQNKHYLGGELSVGFSLRVAIRLTIERWIFRTFRHHISRYFVQTYSMKRALNEWWRKWDKYKLPDCIIFPFAKMELESVSAGFKKWDFVFPADGVAHKNHVNLFRAWEILADEGIFPSLVITLADRDKEVNVQKQLYCNRSGAKIENVGYLSHESVIEYYHQTKALIFPSLSESFGLPLVEAHGINLPILAPELDYVRDICNPCQTFDPSSPISIARAVKRFLGSNMSEIQVHTAREFIAEMLNEESSSHGR